MVFSISKADLASSGVVRSTSDLVLLRDSKVLTRKTEVKGIYETAMKDLLLKKDLLVFYEPVKFRIPRSESSNIQFNDDYPPDFLTTLFVNGRQVLIELHISDPNYLERIGRFREIWGDRFYYILVKSNLIDKRYTGVEVEGDGEGELGKYVNEFWRMPKIRETRPGQFSKKDMAAWKKTMDRELDRLINSRASEIPSWERAAALINVRRLA